MEKAAAEGKATLPPIGVIAEQCGISYRTVWKAVHGFRREGALIVASQGLHLTGASSPTAAAAPPERERGPDSPLPRWAQVKEMVATDLIAGKYPAGSLLPSYKELCRSYGTCLVTMRKALHPFFAAGRLTSEKRRIRVYQHPSRTALSSIVFIAPTGEMTTLSGYTPRSAEMWRAIETECARYNIALLIHSYAEITGRQKTLDGSLLNVPALQKAKNVQGYLIWTINMANLDTLYALLAPTGKPVGVLEEVTMKRMSMTRALLSNPRFLTVSVGASGTEAKRIGNYLLSLGHRRVACIALFSEEGWMRERIRALEDAYEEAGQSHGVGRFLLQSPASMPELNRTFDERMREYAGIQRTVEQFYHTSLGLPADAKHLTAPDMSTYHMKAHFVQALMEPVFKNALLDKSITAWVCIQDQLALFALDFLRRNSIRVPRDISVVSIDDTIEAFGNRLNSYNYNMPAVVNALLRHVMSYKRSSAGENAPGIIEVPGQIMDRGSVRAV
jgi:DNA-binding LacI/PurR family transcriptional regulator